MVCPLSVVSLHPPGDESPATSLCPMAPSWYHCLWWTTQIIQAAVPQASQDWEKQDREKGQAECRA